MNKLILIVCLFCFANVQAQKSRKEKREARKDKVNALIKQDEEGLLVYRKHKISGVSLTTDGYGAFFEKGIRQDRRKTSLLRFELSEKKTSKEERGIPGGGALGQANTAILFKLNNFYQFRIGYGYQYLLGSKGNKNGIEVSAVGVGGLTLGLVKPYLYDVGDVNGKRFRAGWEQFDTTASIVDLYGASGLTQGWNALKIKPGLFIKTGLRFDYGRFNETVSAVDIGLFGEFYSGKIPQLYLAKQKQFFFGAYLAMLIGKRK
jgi:hypothetical protein